MEVHVSLNADIFLALHIVCNISEDGIAFTDYCDNLKTHNVHVASTSERTKHKTKVNVFLEIRFA
jgi:hypothetical protein